jgi:hypothetical protein
MPLSSFTAGSRETQLRCPRTFWRNSPNRRRQRCQARSCSRSSRGRSKSFGTYPPGLDRTEDERVPSQLVLIASFIVALVLFAFAARESLVRWLSGRSVILAALPLLNAVLLTLYVFGEDSYRGNGISRWDAYRSPGGALGPMYVLSVALMAASLRCCSTPASAIGTGCFGFPHSSVGSPLWLSSRRRSLGLPSIRFLGGSRPGPVVRWGLEPRRSLLLYCGRKR